MKRFQFTICGRLKGSGDPLGTIVIPVLATNLRTATEQVFTGETFEINSIEGAREMAPGVKIKSILFADGEGKASWYGRTFDTYNQFDAYIRTLPTPAMGYYKTDVILTFEDGLTYKARYDMRDEREYLQDHLWNHNLFYGGVYRPSHLTVEQYKNYLSNFNTKPSIEFLLKYEI